MRLTDAKISHLANILTEGLKKDGFLPPSRDDDVRKEIKTVLLDFLKVDDEIDAEVRKKIASLSKKPPEGSQEWSILYRQYFREEEVRRGR